MFVCQYKDSKHPCVLSLLVIVVDVVVVATVAVCVCIKVHKIILFSLSTHLFVGVSIWPKGWMVAPTDVNCSGPRLSV